MRHTFAMRKIGRHHSLHTGWHASAATASERRRNLRRLAAPLPSESPSTRSAPAIARPVPIVPLVVGLALLVAVTVEFIRVAPPALLLHNGHHINIALGQRQH